MGSVSNPLRPVVVLLAALLATPPSFQAQTSQKTRQVPVDGLIFDLKNPDAVRRKDAAISLGTNKVARAVPDLVAAAKDADPAVRREIVVALDKIRDPRGLPAFVALSTDMEKDIREKCIHGLINLYLPQESGLGVTLNKVANFFNPWSDEWADVVIEPGVSVDPAAMTVLRDRLSDPEEGIRVKAARALGILRGRDTVPALLESLRQDRSNAVRFETLRALRKIGDAAVARDLVTYCTYSDAKVRNEAVFTIGRFRYREAVPELTRLYEKESALPPKRIDKQYREHLLEAIAFIADPGSKDLFLKEMKNPDEALRLHAVEGIARVGDASLVTDISRDHVHEKDPKVLAAQAYALYRMGRKEFLDEVVLALANRRSHDEARQYLAELRPEELPELYAEIRNKDVAVRESLAEVIGIVGDSRAVAPLQELAKDRRGQITALANRALRRVMARQQ
jgi:HEAT repeat protein